MDSILKFDSYINGKVIKIIIIITAPYYIVITYIHMCSLGGRGSRSAQEHQVYSDIARTYLFYPLAFETMKSVKDFFSQLGHRIFSVIPRTHAKLDFSFIRFY
jgi:hypothetical protein